MFKEDTTGQTHFNIVEEHIQHVMLRLRERGAFNNPEEVEEFFERRLKVIADIAQIQVIEDLLVIAGQGELEELRREVEKYAESKLIK